VRLRQPRTQNIPEQMHAVSAAASLTETIVHTLQLGAVCSTATSSSTTHVVAMQPGTDKALWARSAGKPVVSPAWLLQSGTMAVWSSHCWALPDALQHDV